MSIGTLLKKIRSIATRRGAKDQPPPKPRTRSEQDIYFTQNFHERADAWGLTEAHARHVFYEGDPVKGKENMKVATYKGQEIGIYVFRDRDTNQPVITSIWKRPVRGVKTRTSRR
jgi:hypothetical protein